MSKFSFWQRWLFVVGLVIAAFGLVMALLNSTRVFELFNRQIDPVFWVDGAMPEAAARFRQWVYGAWGATVAGWGIFVAFIAHYPFRRREEWSWNCLAAGLLVWYLVDTAISLCFRVYFNAAFNSNTVIRLWVVFHRCFGSIFCSQQCLFIGQGLIFNFGVYFNALNFKFLIREHLAESI